METKGTLGPIGLIAAALLVLSCTAKTGDCLAAQPLIDRLTGPRVINGVPYQDFTVYTFGRGRKAEPYKNEIVGASLSDPKTFNPSIANETSSTDILQYVFEGLTMENGVTAKIEPGVAERWSASEDGLVWTFHFRRDGQFSDGAPLTADDVLFSYNDICFNESIPGVAMRDIFKIEGEYPLVEKIDDYSVKITLPAKFAPFLRMTAGLEILPKRLLKKAVDSGDYAATWNVGTDPKQVVGTGPFKISEYTSGDRVVLTANEHYWYSDNEGRQFPQIKKMTLLICPDLNTMMVKFRARQTDGYPVRGEDYATLRRLAIENDFSIYDGGVPLGSEFLMFNQNAVSDPRGRFGVPKEKQVWFRDQKFREACAYAIDRETLINNVLMGIGAILDAAEPPSNPVFHNPNVKKYRYDLREARRILKEAGYIDYDGDGIIEKPKGVPVKFLLSTNTGNNLRVNAAQVITTDLRKLGMDVTFSPLEFNNLVSKLQVSLDWEAMLLGLTGSLDPHWGKNVWSYDGRTHFWNQKPQKPSEESQLGDWKKMVAEWESGVTDWEKEISDLYEKGAQEMDEEKRVKVYWKCQEIVAEQLPLVMAVTPEYLAAVRNKFVNLKLTPLARRLFHNADRELMIKP